jgi:hypothetical protein
MLRAWIPALTRVAFEKHRVAEAQVMHGRVMVRTEPREEPETTVRPVRGRRTMAESMTALFLSLVPWPGTGLAAASTAYTDLPGALLFPGRNVDASRLATVIFQGLVLLFATVLGLWRVRRMDAAWFAAGAWWRRAAGLTLAFAPPGLLWSLALARGPAPGEWWALAVMMALVACGLAAAMPAPKPFPALVSTRATVGGVLLTALAYGGVEWNLRRAASVRNEERQSMLREAAKVEPLAAGFPKRFFQRGVNFTSEGPAHYGTKAANLILPQLKEKHVDAIAIVPYGFTRNGDPRVSYGRWTAESDEGVTIVAAEAHRLGMRVMLKPQVWTNTGFPGDLAFPDAAQRQAWFAEYVRFTEHYAKLAVAIHADIFCMGTEFVKLSPYDGEWRHVIAKVREIYPGPLTYAATQGEEFESITFWDALDYIGLNNYYPLPDDLSAAAVVAKVEAVQKKYGRPVIFPEAGLSSVEGGHREPWGEPARSVDLTLQARAYEALLAAFYEKPWFHGVYWWRVGSNGEGGPGDGRHTPWRKPAMDVVAKWYARPRALE